MDLIAVTTANLSVFALGAEGGVTFTVNASVAPANSGTISGTGSYADGSSASVVAAPSAGYVFTNWTEAGSVVSTSPSYTFIVNNDRTLVANFVPVGAARTITTSSLPSNGGTTSGDGAYAPESTATVGATAHAGYKFSKWLVDGAVVSTARNYAFTVTGDLALVAKFKPVYTMVVSADPPDGGEVEADPIYEPGELAKLKAKPNTGYSFVNWTQNGTPVSTAAIYQFNVTGNRELVGHFALGNRIDVSAEPANGGTAFGNGVYPGGASVTVEATANPGYVFLNWTESNTVVSTSSSYNFTSEASHTLVANFIAQPALQTTVSLGAMTLSWPAGASGWVLQESPELSPGSWMDSTRPENVVGNQKQVTVTPATGIAFFRLAHP